MTGTFRVICSVMLVIFSIWYLVYMYNIMYDRFITGKKPNI